MSKQTAVEWLLNELIRKSEYEHLPDHYFFMSDKDVTKIIEQAKAMEREQIMKFAIKAVTNAVNEDINNPYNLEQLFAKTYESKGSETKQ